LGNLRKIVKLLKGSEKLIILSIGMIIAVCGLRLVFPYIPKIIVDDVIEGGRRDLFWRAIFLFAGATLIQATLRYLRANLSEKLGQNVLKSVRERMYDHMQEMSYRFYDEHQIGEIMSRMTGDINNVQGFFTGTLVVFIDNVFNFVGALVICFILCWQLTLVSLLAISPLLLFIAYRFNKAIRPTFDAVREQNAALNARAQEGIAGIRVVKAFAREAHEKERFAKENIAQRDASLLSTRVWRKFNPWLDFVGGLSPVIMLLLGGFLVVRGVISLGDMLAFSGYVWMISGPMRNVGGIVNSFNSVISSSEKIFYYLELGPGIRDADDAVEPEHFEGNIRFDHVTFRYTDTDVLEDVSFNVAPGKTLAIMGLTGAGKTSVVQLLGRFYECYKGAVMLDGVDVKKLKLQYLRDKIGFVMQETFLFSETIRNNIAFGRPQASQEEVDQAARVAQVQEFLSEMPLGQETVVGERGMGLSGGQKQRVAIARALCKKPSILVFDDSTSAVDMETEFEIQQELDRMPHPCTKFIIAHRISSVKDADEIIVLDHGRVIERGTHQSLLEQQGWYYRLYQTQFKDYTKLNAQGEGEVG